MIRKLGCSMLVVLALACSKDEAGGDEAAAQGTSEKPAVEPAFDTSQPEAIPADQPGTKQDLRAHLNLLNLAHLADVDHEGLFVDFGTPAADKYTVGGWKTGWGESGREGESSFAYVASDTGRLYLPLTASGDKVMRLRVKPIGTATMQLYLNNEPLPVVRMEKGDFAEYDVPIEKKLLRDGENYLLLRFGDTVQVNGQDVSVAIDWLRVMPAALASAKADAPAAADEKPAADKPAYVSPRYASLVQSVTVGASQRRALAVHAPTTLSYHLQVPPQASLSFRVGKPGKEQATARVHVTPEGAQGKQVFEAKLGEAWQDGVVSLSQFAGQVVRLDLSAEGGGQVAWSSPTVMVPEVKVDKPKTAKNVVVLLVDTLRASKLRVYNKQERVKTPAIDAFASEGTVFDAAQAPENWTKPSVASVLTGLYPLTHGTKRTESKLPEKAVMVSEAFQQAGFKTASFLANGYVSNKFGFDQGWDHYTNYIREGRSTEAENVFKEAGNWIEKHKDGRFFVYIQTIDPHVPYDPPKEFLDMYDPDEYTGPVTPRQTPDLLEKAKRNPPKVTFTARDRKRLESLHNAEISYHDKYLGEFIAKLKKLGLYDDMLFVITSDHGEEFYEHGSYGHGHSVYQEMIHVPMMFRQPGVIPAGKRIAETVGTLDISPTALTAAGVQVPEEMEGRNRLGHILGAVPAGPAVAFSDFLDDRHVVRAGRWKLVLRGNNSTLFDLEKDPGEQTELQATDRPVAMRYCRVMLGQFLGAKDKRAWLSAERGPGKNLSPEDTNIDAETAGHLKALGYAN